MLQMSTIQVKTLLNASYNFFDNMCVYLVLLSDRFNILWDGYLQDNNGTMVVLEDAVVVNTVSLITTRNTYIYKNIRLYFYFRRWYLCGEEKQSQRVRVHKGAVRRRKSQWTTDFSRNSGTYIVYNSLVTSSISSFWLTMVTPTSHVFAFHWLCCLLPIGYLPTPGFVGVRIYHSHRIQPHSQFRWYSDIFDRMHLFSTSTVFTAPVGVVTFRQSPCWYYPWVDAAVSTSPDTQHLWTWWHFGDHTCLINISVNNIRRILTQRSC